MRQKGGIIIFNRIDESDFESGKVIAAIHKDCIYALDPTDFRNLFLDGIEVEKTEPLFYAKDSGNHDNIGAIIMIYLRFKEKPAVIDAINRLASNPCVVFAEPDFFLSPHIIPNDPYFGFLWGMEAIGGPPAWNYTTGSSSVVVGVIDSGIEYNHPDLRDNMWDIPRTAGLHGWDFYNNTGNPIDRTGHGTHIAGTVGAIGNNFAGVTGVCWNVKMASLKIGNYLFDIAAAIKSINYANQYGIPILNASWGSIYYSSSLKYAIDHYDGLIIASAGNSSSNNDVFSVYPASYDSRNIISVAATDPFGRLALFSNYGAVGVDIAAPGADIFSTSLFGGYSFMSGTSMSAPHVSGAAALLKSYIPALTALEIKNIILSSAEKHPYLSGRVLSEGTLNIRRMMDMVAR